MTIVKLTITESQWLQNGLCNFISILSMKPEVRDEATNRFIAHFGLNAANNNIVTQIKLWPLWSWHCQLHNGHKMGSVALLLFAVWGPKCCNSARWLILQVTLCLGAIQMSFCYIDDLQQQYPGWIYKKGLKFNSEEIIFVLKHQYSKEHAVKKIGCWTILCNPQKESIWLKCHQTVIST